MRRAFHHGRSRISGEMSMALANQQRRHLLMESCLSDPLGLEFRITHGLQYSLVDGEHALFRHGMTEGAGELLWRDSIRFPPVHPEIEAFFDAAAIRYDRSRPDFARTPFGYRLQSEFGLPYVEQVPLPSLIRR